MNQNSMKLSGPTRQKPSLWARAHGKAERLSSRYFFRRPFVVRTDVPIISFTFDDFPRSAFLEGARILNGSGVTGTFYASLGLAGKIGPSGPMFYLQDLKTLLKQGHELGCHTFSHCHSWNTPSRAFEKSVVENQATLTKFLPGVLLRTLAYPISDPRPGTKRRMARHFNCCRGGGQTFNVGVADRNWLHAFFLEKARGNLQLVKDVIDGNRIARGWLILATHDVREVPSHYGCTPRFFEEIVRYAVRSGAQVLPVVRAWEAVVAGTDGDAFSISQETNASRTSSEHVKAVAEAELLSRRKAAL